MDNMPNLLCRPLFDRCMSEPPSIIGCHQRYTDIARTRSIADERGPLCQTGTYDRAIMPVTRKKAFPLARKNVRKRVTSFDEETQMPFPWFVGRALVHVCV